MKRTAGVSCSLKVSTVWKNSRCELFSESVNCLKEQQVWAVLWKCQLFEICIQDSGRLLHCVTVYGKKEYLYVFFEVNLCLKVCWWVFLVIESADIMILADGIATNDVLFYRTWRFIQTSHWKKIKQIHFS